MKISKDSSDRRLKILYYLCSYFLVMKRFIKLSVSILSGIFFSGAAIAFLLVSCTTSSQFDENQWHQAVADSQTEKLFATHHNGQEFYNPWMPSNRTFTEFLRWKFFPKSNTYTEEEKVHLPAVLPDTMERIRQLDGRNFILWIGHNTFLMRLEGEYWLTDPMFSERALLPKRKTPPALTAEDINSLKGNLHIIITHNHYDHLDEESITRLRPDAAVYIPLGLEKTIRGLNKTRIFEMDWWQEIDLGGGKRVVCLPAQHWSRRIGQGRNTTLWASFLLQTPSVTLYFGGDSGYFVGFREIGRRYPGIDFAFLPTTAYHPRWFMHHAHMNIQENIRAFEDLNAGFFIPTQWGAFHLGDEPPGYPPLDLKREIVRLQKDPSRYIIMDIGQLIDVKTFSKDGRK
jgi:L-ascorbate metabolism protein UlaG (beta-lactamase superfamily)